MQETDIKKTPLKLIIFLYSCPFVCALMIYLGIKFQSFHTAILFYLSVFMLFASTSLFPFVKKKKPFTKQLFLGMSLFFVLLLFNHVIQLPLLFVIPILPAIKLYFAFCLAYFSYFFMYFLADKDLMYYYNLVENQKELADARIAKYTKWRKMFIYSLITIIILFLGTSIYMVFSNTFESNKIGEIKLPEYVSKIYKDINQISQIRRPDTQNLSANARKSQNTESYSFKNISFQTLKGLSKMESDARLLLYKKANNKKFHVITLEIRPTFYSTDIYIKQLALSRYISYAKQGQNNIVVSFFTIKDTKNVGCYITSGNFREIMVLYPREKDLVLFYALLSKTTYEYVPKIVRSLSVP